MVNILPAAPHGTTDQMSPLNAADPLSSDAGEKFPVEDARIAVDSLNVDWNEQAVKSAKSYLKINGFSCQGLIDQLSSQSGEKFTLEQAKYAATQVGLC